MSSNNSSTNIHSSAHLEIIQNLEVINIVIRSLEATSITITNLVVILLYIRMKKKCSSIANYLIFSQSLTDLFVGLMTCIQVCMQIPSVKESYHLHLMLIMYTGMLEYSLILTIGSLFLASFERYLCITKPIFHKQCMTKRKIILGSCIVWILSLIPPLTLISLMDFHFTNTENVAVTIYSCVFDIVILILIGIVVLLLALSLKVSKRSCDRHSERCRSLDKKQAAAKRTTRLVTIFMCMIVAYAVTFLPFAGTRLMYDVGMLEGLSHADYIIVFIVCNTFYKSSSLFNPLLSISMKKDFRNMFATTFRHS